MTLNLISNNNITTQHMPCKDMTKRYILTRSHVNYRQEMMHNINSCIKMFTSLIRVDY